GELRQLLEPLVGDPRPAQAHLPQLGEGLEEGQVFVGEALAQEGCRHRGPAGAGPLEVDVAAQLLEGRGGLPAVLGPAAGGERGGQHGGQGGPGTGSHRAPPGEGPRLQAVWLSDCYFTRPPRGPTTATREA